VLVWGSETLYEFYLKFSSLFSGEKIENRLRFDEVIDMSG